MTMGDILVLFVLALAAALAVRSLIRSKKKGGCGGCSGCAHAGQCGHFRAEE